MRRLLRICSPVGAAIFVVAWGFFAMARTPEQAIASLLAAVAGLIVAFGSQEIRHRMLSQESSDTEYDCPYYPGQLCDTQDCHEC